MPSLALDGQAGQLGYTSDGTAYLAIIREDGSRVMIRSEDRGLSWTPVFTFPEGARRYFLVNGEFYFTLEEGNILRTDLTGTARGQISLPTADNIRQVHVFSADGVYVAADSLYLTLNGGSDWRGIAGGRTEILDVNSAGECLATQMVDLCPTDVGPAIDVLLRVSATGTIEAGPRVARLNSSIAAAHVFEDGTSLVAFYERVFGLR